MSTTLWVVAGAALGLLVLAPFWRRPPRAGFLTVLVTIVIMNAIYVGAALDQTPGVLLAEVAPTCPPGTSPPASGST